jgi:hypothetical protein
VNIGRSTSSSTWPSNSISSIERRDKRVLRKVFGQPDVAHDAGQAGDQPGGFDPPDRVDRLLGR